ncbi:porin [Methylobacterium sp. NEAU 140]|uniref:porin n=1 Tax=Methylobacterium sp. NEAU 140 TaxID=3064945 RepID=UPI0027334FEB|nr:porin [Methylobacterium sp. NEAU 140]MDP4021928.1 porin [Methylobacterium sp. NEAU 140]
MKLLRSSLLGSAAAFAAVGAAHAADLPVKKAVPIEYVRICTAYGAGFFYIPGTDTCIRLSGRARFEGGYQTAYTRQFGQGGDTAGYRGLARINVDARTQTGYGTLRAFLRIEVASRTGGPYGGGTSGTQQRIAQAFPGLGVDQFGRSQMYVNADKAFVQFAGITAGRASSFFDFYAHDFEFTAATAGSDIASTNLLAYTATLGNGFSATLSVEDPVFRRSGLFSPTVNANAVATNAAVANFGITSSPIPVITGYNAAGFPSRFNFVDGIEKSRLPDFVGALRYDSAWGSAQLSAAVHELNANNVQNNVLGFVPGAGLGTAATAANGSQLAFPHTRTDYGWAVQGGLKVNAPFIAPGDTFYLQAAYGEGAQLYTGYSSYSGGYIQNSATIQGQKFQQYFADATVNPITGQIQKSNSFTVSAAYLHYWAPEWRSAVFGSYGEMDFGAGARAAQGLVFNVINPNNSFAANGIGLPGTRFYQLSQALRDTYQFVAGANLIWSPVKDLDIGVEGLYTQIGVQRGRVIDLDKDPTAYSRVAAINAGGLVRTATNDGVSQVRIRVQRDF